MALADGQMRGGERQFHTGREHDLRVRLLRYYVLFAGVILVCVLLLAAFLNWMRNPEWLRAIPSTNGTPQPG